MSAISVEDLEIGPEQAVAIIVEANSRKVYDGSPSEDPKKNVAAATELVELSIDEWTNSSPAELNGEIGEDVKALLGLAGIYPDADGTLVRSGEAAVEAPAAPAEDDDAEDRLAEEKEALEREEAARDEEPPAVEGLEEPWSGYNGQTLAQIKSQLNEYGDLSQEERDYIVGYEQANKRRKGIIDFLTDDPTATPEHEELDDQMDAAVAKDDEADASGASANDLIPVIVAGADAEWSWDDVYQHVVVNENTNLQVMDGYWATHLEKVLAEKEDALKAAEAEHEPTQWKNESKVEIIPGTGKANSGPHAPVEHADEVELLHADEPKHLAGVEESSHAARALAVAKAEKEKLPIPPEPAFDEDPQLPRDFSQVGADELNQLYLDFTACLVRATWLASLARIDHRTHERIADREERMAYLRARGIDPETGKPKTVAVIEAEAASDPELLRWREQESAAKDEYQAFEALRDAYKASVDALSRVGGFRHEEAVRAR